MTGGGAAGILGLIAGHFLRTTVILTLALVAAAAAKKRPAAFRHFILSSALIGLLLFPLLTLAPVGWRSPLLPEWMAAPGSRAAGAPAAEERGESVGAYTTVALSGEAAVDRQPSGSVRSEAGSSLRLASPANQPVVGERTSPLLPNSATLGSASRPASSSNPANRAQAGGYSVLIAVLWAAGLAALLLRLAFGLAGAVRLTAEGTALDDPAWRILVARFLAFVSLRRTVRLKSHPEVLVPLTWGWRKPIVLLPDGANAWSDEERLSALYHELSHIKRADFLVMLLVRTSLALFWWNPLCWIVYRELRKEQEIACDELVLRAGIKPSTYAASLLAFRRSAGLSWNPSAALLGMLGRSSFQERVAAILKQKFTFMEVKMKTKIMLALALVLAVALIGTARPAVGIEKDAAATTEMLASAAMPASFDIATPAPAAQETQAEKAVVQEKEKEKAVAQEKAKAAEKAKEAEKAQKEKAIEKRIVVTTREGGKTPIEITITEGDQVKRLVLDKSLTITKGKDGEVLILTPEGKEPLILKGEPLRLEIKGGGLEVIREGKALKIGEGGVYRIVKEGGEGSGRIVFYETGEPVVAGEKVKIVKEGEAGTAWTIVEPGKGEGVWVVKESSGKPVAGTWVGGGGKTFAFSSATDKEMLDKVHALQEQVAAIKAKKMDITALEESLKKLEAELKAKEEKLRELEYKLYEVPGDFAVAKRIRGEEDKGDVAVWVAETAKDAEADKGRAVVTAKAVGIGTGKGTINLILTGKKGDEGEKAFESALVRLRKELPEGYTIADQKYDPEGGTMRFEIAAPQGQKTDETLVRKLLEILKTEIDKK